MFKKKVNCDYCNKEIIKEIDGNLKHHFCNRNCYHNWSSENICGINHPRFGKKNPSTSERMTKYNPMYNSQSRLKMINTLKEGYKTGRIKLWSKGLTKEIDDTLKELSEKSMGRIFSEKHKENIKNTHWNKSDKREKTIEKLSNTRRKLFKEGKIKIYNKGLTKENCESLMESSKKLNGRLRPETTMEKNPNWKGGISFEPYGLDFNKKIKRIIKERDSQCMLCNANFEILKELKRKVHTHHIDYIKTNNFPQNLITLCVKCHTLTNFNREKWKIFFQSVLKEKYNYEYTEDQKIILDFTK